MDASINSILEALGETISREVVAANTRASAAEAKLNQLVTGLSSLLTTAPANDLAVSEPVISMPNAERETHTKLASRISDEVLRSTLSSTWMGARQIMNILRAEGHAIAEGTVYNRMRKLEANCAYVEATTKPERWRLKSSDNNDTEGESPARTIPSTAKRHVGLAKVKKVSAINDNAPTGLYPALHHGDCFEVMKNIADRSVSLILADLPYGTTRCAWDHPLPLDRLWEEYRRILKPTGAVVLFGSQPFTSKLACSNLDWFKYTLVWEKNLTTGFFNAANKPLKSHEDILVFSPGTTIHATRSKRRMTYNPQGAISAGTKRVKKQRSIRYMGNNACHNEGQEYEATTNCPRSVLKFAKDAGNAHPFQKPAALLEYLIKTYSNEGEVVLDNTMGSGSTCVAAMRTGRVSIGIELDRKWFDIASARVSAEASSARNDNEWTLESPIKPVVATRSLKLYQGDCLDVMRTMPSGSVDLIFTSPPYNLGVSSGGGMRNSVGSGRWKNAALADGYASYDDARDPDEYIEWQKEVLRECWRLLSPTGAIFYQHKPRGQNKVLQTPLDLNPGLPVRQIIIWNRNNGFNFNSSYFLSTHEWIVVFAKPDFRLTDEGKRLKDVWTIKPERNNPHPAPFPVELPLTAIQATSAKVILDPFMGSGTTGVAALRCGREFIGIELDPGYLKDAHNRIRMDGLAHAA